MCWATTCSTCFDITWDGCGEHIDMVRAAVVQNSTRGSEPWCTCPVHIPTPARNVSANLNARIGFVLGLEHLMATFDFVKQTSNFAAVGSYPPLLAAARHGHADCVRWLLRAGADVDAQPSRNLGNCTALGEACAAGHLECVRVLLDAGADPNLRVRNGGTPSCVAAENNHVDSLRLLHGAGADMNRRGYPAECTPLYVAAAFGAIHCLGYLIDIGADLHLPAISGATPLYAAAEAGHVDCVRALLDAGAPVDTPGPDKVSPACAAAVHDRVACLEVLLGAGANVNALAMDGTAAFGAAWNGCHRALAVLIRAGADLRIADMDGSRPVHAAAIGEQRECLRILHRMGSCHEEVDIL